ncbi:MAG: hypothetical protein ACC682_10920 [Gemmatimonadota bacterium]
MHAAAAQGRFGGTAWDGRAPCPSCGSVLIRLFFMKCADLVLFTGADGTPALGMPCARSGGAAAGSAPMSWPPS